MKGGEQGSWDVPEAHLTVASGVAVPAGERLEQAHEPGPLDSGRVERWCDRHGGGCGLFAGGRGELLKGAVTKSNQIAAKSVVWLGSCPGNYRVCLVGCLRFRAHGGYQVSTGVT